MWYPCQYHHLYRQFPSSGTKVGWPSSSNEAQARGEEFHACCRTDRFGTTTPASSRKHHEIVGFTEPDLFVNRVLQEMTWQRCACCALPDNEGTKRGWEAYDSASGGSGE